NALETTPHDPGDRLHRTRQNLTAQVCRQNLCRFLIGRDERLVDALTRKGSTALVVGNLSDCHVKRVSVDAARVALTNDAPEKVNNLLSGKHVQRVLTGHDPIRLISITEKRPGRLA